MLRPRITGTDFGGISAGLEDDVAGFVTEAMRDTTRDVQEAFRAEVRAAGLGERLANAVREQGLSRHRKSLRPAGWIYAQPSKTGRGAAAIIDSYATGATIFARGGRQRLAIPTDDCPRKRGGDALTPAEVEAKFNRRLVEISPADKGFHTPSVRHRGTAYLVMKGLVIRKATGRWRQATQNEKAGKTRNPRPLQSVIMFTLVRSVKKPRSVDLSAPAALAETRFPANLSARWR